MAAGFDVAGMVFRGVGTAGVLAVLPDLAVLLDLDEGVVEVFCCEGGLRLGLEGVGVGVGLGASLGAGAGVGSSDVRLLFRTGSFDMRGMPVGFACEESMFGPGDPGLMHRRE